MNRNNYMRERRLPSKKQLEAWREFMLATYGEPPKQVDFVDDPQFMRATNENHNRNNKAGT